jgi:hypothetical protein
MQLIKKLFNLPADLTRYILEFLEFEYNEYFFYNNKRRCKGLISIKLYPLYNYFFKTEDQEGFITLKERKPRAGTF